jgi:hypothetical protein
MLSPYYDDFPPLLIASFYVDSSMCIMRMGALVVLVILASCGALHVNAAGLMDHRIVGDTFTSLDGYWQLSSKTAGKQLMVSVPGDLITDLQVNNLISYICVVIVESEWAFFM